MRRPNETPLGNLILRDLLYAVGVFTLVITIAVALALI